MEHGIYEKYEKLKSILRGYGAVAVAFSGGLDSSFLLKAAHDVLGADALGITADSPVHPSEDMDDAVSFAERYGIRHIVVAADQFEVPEFVSNKADRCYHCKKFLFKKVIETARMNGIKYVADGTCVDDAKDYRPGMKALQELQVVSPLADAGLDKKDIRALSAEQDLPSRNKLSSACHATRIPYGTAITREKLNMVGEAERFLAGLGFSPVRVRHHGDIARIEAAPEMIGLLFEDGMNLKITTGLRKIGFTYITADLAGYRTGSMNEVLAINKDTEISEIPH